MRGEASRKLLMAAPVAPSLRIYICTIKLNDYALAREKNDSRNGFSMGSQATCCRAAWQEFFALCFALGDDIKIYRVPRWVCVQRGQGMLTIDGSSCIAIDSILTLEYKVVEHIYLHGYLRFHNLLRGASARGFFVLLFIWWLLLCLVLYRKLYINIVSIIVLNILRRDNRCLAIYRVALIADKNWRGYTIV